MRVCVYLAISLCMLWHSAKLLYETFMMWIPSSCSSVISHNILTQKQKYNTNTNCSSKNYHVAGSALLILLGFIHFHTRGICQLGETNKHIQWWWLLLMSTWRKYCEILSLCSEWSFFNKDSSLHRQRSLKKKKKSAISNKLISSEHFQLHIQ